jgi:hypothetical protein
MAQILSRFCDFTFRNLVNLDAKVSTLQLKKPRNEIYVGDLMALVGLDPTVQFSQYLHLENDFRNFPAPLQDLTTSSTSQILHGEFRPSNSLTIFCKMNTVSPFKTCPPAKQLRYASFQHFKALILSKFLFINFEDPIPPELG